jgi:hypothetical protein
VTAHSECAPQREKTALVPAPALVPALVPVPERHAPSEGSERKKAGGPSDLPTAEAEEWDEEEEEAEAGEWDEEEVEGEAVVSARESRKPTRRRSWSWSKGSFMAALLHCYTALLLHYCTASLLHCFTASLLHGDAMHCNAL